MSVSAKVTIIVLASALQPTLCASRPYWEDNESSGGSSVETSGTSGMTSTGGVGVGTETGLDEGSGAVGGTDAETGTSGQGPATTGEEQSSGETSEGAEGYGLSLLCGNGHIDLGEECDDCDHWLMPSCDQTLCEYECVLGVCGGCTLKCGNGTVESGEDCDDGNRDDGDFCSAECRKEHRAFVTSEEFSGDFSHGDKVYGATAADSRCQAAAEDLYGMKDGVVFRAWIASGDPKGAPAARFEGASITTSKTIIMMKRLRGDEFAKVELVAGWTGLLGQGGLVNPLNIDEHGDVVEDGAFAWTGVKPDGTKSWSDCWDWASDDALWSGGVGDVHAVSGEWTQWSGESEPCSESYHLYCFSQ